MTEQTVLTWQIEKGYKFPSRAFKVLKDNGLLALTLPQEYGGTINLPTADLLKTLMQVGSVELSAGRLYEGHINALALIDRYGNEQQKQRYFKEASEGFVFGIWNTNDPENPVTLDENQIVKGSKIFCSGGLELQRPIITGAYNGETQMLIIHAEDLDKTRENSDRWKPTGMKASRSLAVDFSGYQLDSTQLLGTGNEYMIEPYFSTGAVRFAAVQLGGAQAIAYTAFRHLETLKRTDSPHQRTRMAKMNIALESGRNWLKQAGAVLDNPSLKDEDKINHANMVRSAILELATQIMQWAEQSVGLAGMMEDHALEQMYRDLSVYLKQPGPDQALENVGAWCAIPQHWDDLYG